MNWGSLIMPRLGDLENIPKEYKKKKKLALYKAFILKDGDEMRVGTDFDILSLTHESAILFMMTSLNIEDATTLKGKVINFAVFEFSTDELMTKELVDIGEVYCQDLSISITLKDKLYKINVEDRLIEDIVVEVNPKNEIKEIKLLTLVDLSKNC